MPTDLEKARFRRVWKLGAKMGRLDSWGSRECRRVYREWCAAGCPSQEPGELPIWLWRHANMRADGTLPPDPRVEEAELRGEEP